MLATLNRVKALAINFLLLCVSLVSGQTNLELLESGLGITTLQWLWLSKASSRSHSWLLEPNMWELYTALNRSLSAMHRSSINQFPQHVQTDRAYTPTHAPMVSQNRSNT